MENYDIISSNRDSSPMFCSMTANSEEEKIRLYNIMNSPEFKLADYINMEIEVKDVIVEPVEMANDDGEIVAAPRIVIIDKDGKAYQCVSNGVYSSLRKMFKIFGSPTWDTPKKIRVKQINKSGNRSVITLEMVV